MIPDEVEIRDQEPFYYAYLESNGPSSQIIPRINEFIAACYVQKIVPRGKLFFLYHDFPGEVKNADEVRWTVALPVDEKIKVSEPLNKGEFRFDQIAYYLCKGPYEKSGAGYFKVLDYLKKNGLAPVGPAIQRNLDDPGKTDSANLRTEIIIPVKTKK